MNLVCKNKSILSLPVEILWILPSSTAVIYFLGKNVYSVLFFSFCWGMVLYRSHINERNTNFLSTQQFQFQWELLCGHGLAQWTHPCFSVKRFLPVVAAFSPLIKGRWIMCGPSSYLTHSPGGKNMLLLVSIMITRYLHIHFWSTVKHCFKSYHFT